MDCIFLPSPSILTIRGRYTRALTAWGRYSHLQGLACTFSRATDGGSGWNEASNGLPPPPGPADAYPRMARVSSLVVDPNNSSTVYAGIFSVYWNSPGWVHDAPSLFKSTDGGANWTRADSGLPTGLFGDFTLAADGGNPNTIYAASGDS